MFDESQGTLRLVHDGLGDERVPSLSLEKLKEIYRGGRGSVCSWRTTAGLVNRGTNLTAECGRSLCLVSLCSSLSYGMLSPGRYNKVLDSASCSLVVAIVFERGVCTCDDGYGRSGERMYWCVVIHARNIRRLRG